MKKVIFCLFFTLISVLTWAQDSQTGYNFLRLPVSAHAAALGSDNISIIEDDPSLMFHNPALLSSVSDKSLNLNYMNYMEGANAASASFSKIVKEKATIGVMAQFLDYGKMKEVDEHNVQTGEFSAKDIAIAGALSYQLGTNIVGGITARLITSYIGDYNAFAMGVDLGVNYYDPEKEWSVSATVKNLGGELDAFEEEYNKLPLDLQIGASKRLIGSPLRLSATLVDMNHLNKKFIHHLVAGADIILSPQIYLAVGYNFRRASEMEIVSNDEERGSSHGAGLSLGGGIQLDRFKLPAHQRKLCAVSHLIIIDN